MVKELLQKYKRLPYDYPRVSCLNLITDLSGESPPNYDKWLDKKETECFLEISRMPGNTADNYVEAHREALKDGWIETDQEGRAGDIVFYEYAEGYFTDIELSEIHWGMPHGIPATTFPDEDGNLWAFAPRHGLRRVHETRNKLATFTRRVS